MGGKSRKITRISEGFMNRLRQLKEMKAAGIANQPSDKAIRKRKDDKGGLL